MRVLHEVTKIIFMTSQRLILSSDAILYLIYSLDGVMQSEVVFSRYVPVHRYVSLKTTTLNPYKSNTKTKAAEEMMHIKL